MLNLLLILFFASVVTADSSSQFKIDNKYLNVLGFKLEQSKLKDIENKFGKTIKYKSGDASTSDTRLNYYLIKDKVFITFSSCEMGGGIYLTDVIMRDKINEKATEINDTLKTDDFIGLRIGNTKQYIESKLITKIETDSIRIRNENKLKIKGQEYNEQRTLELYFKDNKLVKAILWKITSN
jgi:hypothetical protein